MAGYFSQEKVIESFVSVSVAEKWNFQKLKKNELLLLGLLQKCQCINFFHGSIMPAVGWLPQVISPPIPIRQSSSQLEALTTGAFRLPANVALTITQFCSPAYRGYLPLETKADCQKLQVPNRPHDPVFNSLIQFRCCANHPDDPGIITI